MNKLFFRYKKHALLSLAVALAALFTTGCEGEDEIIPAYLKIEPFVVESTDFIKHGSISHKITNARVFLTDLDNNTTHSLGTLSLPASVPVIVTGNQQVTIDPVIKANGNSLFLQIYPFYERFTTVLELQPNVEEVVQPVTRYVSNAKFEFIEDFEGNGHLFQRDRDGNPLTSIQISSDDVFEGDHSGRVRLDSNNLNFAVSTDNIYNLKFEDVGRVFMEMNYKTDVPIEFGALALNNLNDEIPFIQFAVFSKDEWNKIYFDFTEIIATAGEERFVFVMQAGIPIQGGQPTLDEAFIYFDNIKLIHF